MNIELLVIKLFLVNTLSYLKYHKYTKTKYNNVYNKIYHALSKLKDDGKPSHSVEELAFKFHVCYPVLSAGEGEALEHIFGQLSLLTVQPEQADELLTKLQHRSIASELALKAVEVASGDATLPDLSELFLSLTNGIEQETEENEFVTDNIVEIQQKNILEPPFEFRLKILNQILGGLRRRTFGFIFARPEIGKTQFLASEATFLAPQTERGILWINNEEDGAALVPRLYQAALLKESHEIFYDAEEARKAYTAKIKGRIKIYDRPTANTRDIEALVRNIRPDIVFIDQLDKVRGVSADRYDLQQKALYQWARELAKKYNCAVVGVCQAGGTAENKRYLDMNDVDSSHTAKQGEADWLFGLGATDRAGDEDSRYISVCKNKLPATPKMISDMRHAKVRIKSVPELQIYEDTINVS